MEQRDTGRTGSQFNNSLVSLIVDEESDRFSAKAAVLIFEIPVRFKTIAEVHISSGAPESINLEHWKISISLHQSTAVLYGGSH